jgi:hypothetical protein
MKPLPQQILIGIGGCIALTVIFGYGLSIAVNYGIAQFEQQAGEFLPGSSPDAPADPSPTGR